MVQTVVMGTVSGLRWVVAMFGMGTVWGAEAPGNRMDIAKEGANRVMVAKVRGFR